jgi:hypothetical protein
MVVNNGAAVRKRQFGVFWLVAFLVTCASSTALAAQPNEARFRVKLTGTLTKTWTFTRSEGEPGCIITTRGTGKWEVKLATRSATRVRAVVGRDGRVRFFGGPIRAIAGTATRSGTTSVNGQGSPPCERQTKTIRCDVQRRAFRGATSSLLSPRRGVLQLGPLRRAAGIRSFPSGCPEEPPDIRSIQTDLPISTGPLSRADVVARNVPAFFVSGDSEQTTAISGDVEGNVTERVRWTATFTRLR